MYKQKFDLSRKTVVLTGAGGLLGLEQARAVLEMGGRLFMLDVEGGAIAGFIKKLSLAQRKRACFEKVDIKDEKSVAGFFRSLDKSKIFANVLINNAACRPKKFFQTLDDYDLADWREVLEVNLTGMFLMSKHAVKRMAAKRDGLVINFSSIYGINGPDISIYEGSEYLGKKLGVPPVYSASKAGAIGLTKYIATVYGGRNVRSNAITPGGIYNGQNGTFVEKYSRRVPMGKMGSAGDIASAIVFLCSDAAGYINGINLVVDGGLSAW